MESERKKLSVVIPVYNAEKWLSGCVDSVLAATDDSAEILLINDGSKDGSKGLIEDYQARYPNKVIAISKPNSGSGETRNFGLERATGKYVCFIDSDDYVDPDYFDKFVSAIETTGADVVVGGYKRVVNGEVQFEVIPKDVPWSRFQILAPWAKIFDLDFINKNHLRFAPLVLGDDDHFATVAYSYADKGPSCPMRDTTSSATKRASPRPSTRGFAATSS
ncbi:MAG: glycosyltransferase family 2 protein [Tractidigestivibacter sp.]|jgi:glycosyltransferase involved in cell wall biosynthesis|uniref:glycosyltransferase family 2 protein n=1 Tax=Tractidigestivibacter sp. TaxID=2847320 RepID=UPI003D94BE71